MSSWVCFGLGGNVGSIADVIQRFGDAALVLERALDCNLSRSRVYVSAPIGPVADQPDYVNAAVGAPLGDRSPRELVSKAIAVEELFGRDRARETPQGPRTLDIDVLLAGAMVSAVPEAQVPHPRLWDRAFALWPLVDLMGAEAVLPGQTATLSSRLGDVEISAQSVRVHTSDF